MRTNVLGTVISFGREQKKPISSLIKILASKSNLFQSNQTMAAQTKLMIKLLIDRKSNRVLFGEAEKNVVDFLFSLFSLPIGSVIRLLKNKKMVGCLGDLYESIETLNETYMQPNQSKDIILRPKPAAIYGSEVSLLLANEKDEYPAGEETTMKYYVCANCNRNISNTQGAICPGCELQIETEIGYCTAANVTKESAARKGEGLGFVKGVVTYMVMDNLAVTPMSTISSITLLNKLNVQDVGSLEEKVVELGVEEGLALLKASFQSKTALSDVYLGKKTEV